MAVWKVQSREWMRPLVHEVHAANSLSLAFSFHTAAANISKMQCALLCVKLLNTNTLDSTLSNFYFALAL